MSSFWTIYIYIYNIYIYIRRYSVLCLHFGFYFYILIILVNETLTIIINIYSDERNIRCTFFYFLSRGINIVNWITTTRKSAEHLRTIYGNTEQLFRHYHVSSAVYIVISITCKTHLGYLAAQLSWLVDLVSPVSIWTGGSVVEIRHCNLWSLVRSLVVKITIYTAVETL